MEINVLNGRYTIAEAEQLLHSFMKLNSDYQKFKADTITHTEQQIANSEAQILQLENYIREAIDKVKNRGVDYIMLHSKLIVEYSPGYKNA